MKLILGVNRAVFETTMVVLAYFVLNTAIGTSTKWIFLYGAICTESFPRECHTFKFPLTITIIHMLFSWGMCHLQIFHLSKRKFPQMSFKDQTQKILPLAVCFSASVAMGNLALKYIFPSFNQMLGATSPLITVALAVLVQRKRFNFWTWVSMPVICGGLIMCGTMEVNFDALGTLFAGGATVLRAMKSIIQGKLLNGDKIDSVVLLYYTAPWAALLLSLAAITSEGLEPVRLLASGLVGSDGGPGREVTGGLRVLGLLIISGLNACLLNVANFSVTAYTGPVTLQVLGNVKNCVSIGVSVAVFRNALKVEQVMGVGTCLLGVWLYQQKGAELKEGSARSGGRVGSETQAQLVQAVSRNSVADRSPCDRSRARTEASEDLEEGAGEEFVQQGRAEVNRP